LPLFEHNTLAQNNKRKLFFNNALFRAGMEKGEIWDKNKIWTELMGVVDDTVNITFFNISPLLPEG